MFDEDISFKSARELIDCFLDENILAPKSLFDVSERLTSGYLFRGQARKDWSLIPSAHRTPEVLKNYTPQPPGQKIPEDSDRRKYLALHIHAELRAVQLFLESADKVGINTPLDYNSLALHQKIFEDLNSGQDIELNSEFPAPQFLTSMAMAQHYGVPTRLLDWTESPLIAAYFAAEQASALAGSDREQSDFSIICLGTQLLRKVSSLKYVSAPRAGNHFLRAQRGAFTLIKNANQYFLENDKWPSIEDAVANERDSGTLYTRSPLIRFSLPADEADNLLRLLYRLDVSKLTVMPSFENAAEHLAYKRALWPKG
ncbi:FRG domain-containing protein [Vreelandella neptunia]|uniref:FRG domain-containing protein n=1 Tax=Vreelandella neptunia TaxID=115551 RepID=UPI00315A4088